jgi:alpha-amylase
VITQDDVLYQIVTDRFADGDPKNNGAVDRSRPNTRHGGDLLGIVQRLPYLQALGVSGIVLSPVYLNPPDGYHGYHPLDFERVDPHLCSPELGPSGSVEVLRRFVEIAHEHGLKVVLDVVVNHTAPDHPWLQERPDWFNPDTPTMEKQWLWGLPDLNHDKIDVNMYFIQNVLGWIKATGVDGMRIDAARHVETKFWQEFKLFAKGIWPETTLIGEVWDPSVTAVAPYQAIYDFDSMLDFPLYYAIVDVFARDQGFGRIARPELSDNEPEGILNRDTAYRNAYQLVTFLDNQDTPRFFHLAGGERNSEDALRRTRLALTFLFTTRGIPQLYYGSEVGLDGGAHPDNRRDMPWEWIDASFPGIADHARDMRRFTRTLIQVRRASMALRYGLLTTLFLTPTLYAFARTYLDDVRIAVLNNAPGPVDVTIPIHANPRLPALALQQLPDDLDLEDACDGSSRCRIVGGSIRVQLPGRSGAIYQAVFPPARRSLQIAGKKAVTV